LALTETGHIWNWGGSYETQLGTVQPGSHKSPAFQRGLGGKITSIAVGAYHFLGLGEDGK